MRKAALTALAQLVHKYPEQPTDAQVRHLQRLKWVGRDGSVTEAGRRALHEGLVEATTRSSCSLGDSNESREGVRSVAAERRLERAQEYLDLLNLLEGRA